ncbi:MAG: UDP-N-acetylmuramoyl-L-alanine--D-glutamate ligase [bacterium]|nr:UDP-N-acetylmuramoyl-L-alanine--D-glutamate ligase [bacterium]
MAWDVREREIWVVGLARSGCAAGALLRDEGARVLGIDDASDEAVRRRWEREGLTNLAPKAFDDLLIGGGWPDRRPDAVVISPGVPTNHPRLAALPADVPLLGETEVGARFCAAPLVAVTGTNGKSTTTAWIAHLARAGGRRAEAVGNLGRPLSQVARELEPADLAVVEVSSFQLETVDTFSPRVGVVLNLAPDHLDRYPDLAAYFAAKRVLAERTAPGGTFVTWTGCPEAVAWSTPAQRVLFGDPAKGATVGWCDGVLAVGDQAILPESELSLRTPANLLNALAATAAALAADVPAAAVTAGLRDFPGLAHRHQLVARRGGVNFVNDTKATNVHAVCAGLDGYRGEVVLIAGGSGKGEDYTPLRQVMGPVRHVVTIGAEGPAIGAVLRDVVPVSAAADLDEAVRRSADLAEPDAAVLLSPACASFDMFSNYRQRGEAFAAAALAAGAESVDAGDGSS